MVYRRMTALLLEMNDPDSGRAPRGRVSFILGWKWRP